MIRFIGTSSDGFELYAVDARPLPVPDGFGHGNVANRGVIPPPRQEPSFGPKALSSTNRFTRQRLV